jgi:hypothetical protein
MFGSQRPEKPHTRTRPKRRPPWSDPETRVTLTHATVVTVGTLDAPMARFLISVDDARRIALDCLYGMDHAAKGGA